MASSISSRVWRALPPLLTTTAIAATVAAAAAAATATRSALASATASLAAARTRGGAALTRSAAAVAGASVVAVRGVMQPLAAATAAAAVTPTAVAAVRAGGAPAAAGWAAVAAAAVGEAAAAAVGGAAATAALVAVLGVAGRGRVDGTRRGAGVGRTEAGVLLIRLRDRLAGGGPGGGAWLVTTAVGVAAEVLAAGPLAAGGVGLGGPVTAANLTDLVAAVGSGVASALHAAGGWDVLLTEPPVAATDLEGEPAGGAAAGMPGALEDHPLVDDPPWGRHGATAAATDTATADVAAAAGASPAAVAALAAEAADVLDLALPLGGAPAGGLPAAAATLAAAARVDLLHPGLADGGSLPLARALPALARAGPALLARLASAEGGGQVVGGGGPLGALLDGPDLRRVFAAAFLSGERWPGDGG